MGSDDFFVPDEPVADVLAAYEAGDKGVTAPPSKHTRGVRAIISQGTGLLAASGANRAIGGGEIRLTMPPWSFAPSLSSGLTARR